MWKKYGLVFVIAILCLSFFNSGVSYADEGKVARWEIDLGVKNAVENPVKIFLEDKQILPNPKDVKPVIVRGTTILPARAMFENLGYTVSWIEAEKAVFIRGAETEIKLIIDSDIAFVNKAEHKLEVPATIIDFNKYGVGTTMIPLRFTAESIGCSVKWIPQEQKIVVVPPIPIEGNENIYHGEDAQNKPSIETQPDPIVEPQVKPDTFVQVKPQIPNIVPTGEKEREEMEIAKKLVAPDVDLSLAWSGEKLNPVAAEKIIVIDIGHGGHDSGAIGHQGNPDEYTEKAANMAVGMKLYANLVRAGAKVCLTRDTDIYYTLKERAYMANGMGATIFVSIHNNSSTFPKAHGTETIYNAKVYNGKSEMELYGITSQTIAQNVQNEMIAALGTRDRGIKNRPELGVVRMTKMPAIIVEGAFLSNEENFALMKKTEFSDKYAEAVAKGLIKSMNEAYK